MRRRGDLVLLLGGVLVWLLSDAQRVKAAAGEALALCAGTVIPALFPFLAVSGLVMALGLGEWLSPALRGLMGPLYRLPGTAAAPLVLGLLGGYPIGARTAAELYREGQLTRDEAQRLLTFCNNANPAFFLSVLGAGVFGSVRIGVRLWLIHVASALLTGLVFRGRDAPACRTAPPPRRRPEAPSLSAAVVGAVTSAAGGMMSVCAFVVLFYVLAAPFRALGGPLGAALTGALELFSLTPLLPPSRGGFLLAAICAGWGGACVLCQTAAALDGTGLSVGRCAAGKAVQALLSAVLAMAAVWFL